MLSSNGQNGQNGHTNGDGKPRRRKTAATLKDLPRTEEEAAELLEEPSEDEAAQDLLTLGQRKFIEAVRRLYWPTSAIDASGVTRGQHYAWMREPSIRGKLYRKLFRRAQREAAERLASTAWDRAGKDSDRLAMYFMQSTLGKRFMKGEPLPGQGVIKVYDGIDLDKV